MIYFIKLQILINSFGLQPLPDSLSPELFGYKISDCNTAKTGNSELYFVNLENNVLQLKIGAYLNCIVGPNSQLSFEIINDTLNILIPEYKEINDTVIEKTDSTEKITIKYGISTIACDCFYIVHAGIQNIAVIPKVILLNGSSLRKQNHPLKSE